MALSLLISSNSCVSQNTVKSCNGTLDGSHYIPKFLEGRNIFLISLKRGTRLKIGGSPDDIEGISPPAEANTFCYLFKDGRLIQLVNSLQDIKGHVKIDSEEKAIEYIRLLTSARTYFLFRPKVMIELFRPDVQNSEETSLGRCTYDFFSKHKLENLKCVSKKDYFEIYRYVVVCPWPGADDDSKVAIYKIIEKVYPDGQYEITKKDIILEWKGYIIDGIDLIPMICY